MHALREAVHHRRIHHVAGIEEFRQCGAIRPQQGHLRRAQGLSGRPINEDDLKALGQRVEEDLRSRGLAQVRSEDVGRAILEPLRELDVVAYLRFASVYQNFDGLEDFQQAIDQLKARQAE